MSKEPAPGRGSAMHLPLFFSFKQVVSGNGFIAGVRMNGRAILEEGGESWITGVSPVGFAAGGPDRGTAFFEFRKAWCSILFDIAAESASFEEFKNASQEFLGSEVASTTSKWMFALEAVRKVEYVDPTLRQVPSSEHRITSEVVDLTSAQHSPTENQVEVGLTAAA